MRTPLRIHPHHGVAPEGVVLLDQASAGRLPGVASATRAREKLTDSPQGSVRCAVCGHRVTTPDAAVSRGASHEHVFCNPAGLVFQLVLYRRAPGCLVIDPPSLEFTWFPGYQWRIAGCRKCLAHLGWRFDNTAWDSFFGLIADRIIVESDGE